jgi:serine/threonine protein phosphatase PrpC
MKITGWESYGLTHTGIIRKINQDTFIDLPDKQLWLVADGMGGHKAGEYASAAIVEAFKTFVPEKTIGTTVSGIHRKLQDVNLALCRLAKEEGEQEIIGSTVAILLGFHQYCISLWSGDSRIYLFRNGKLTQITHDHNYGAYLAANGFSLDEANAHPFTQALTHAIGSDEEFFLETHIQEIRPDDIFLLCSDGLNKEIFDVEIEGVLQTAIIQEASEQLMERCLQQGARDNVTIVLAHCLSG